MDDLISAFAQGNGEYRTNLGDDTYLYDQEWNQDPPDYKFKALLL